MCAREKIGNMLRQISDRLRSCRIKRTVTIANFSLSHVFGIEERPVCIFVN